MKFDDCAGNDGVVFQSSDPVFSVRTDGSIFAQEEVVSLHEPVQFKVTASGPQAEVWETVIQLTATDLTLPEQNENEVSYTEKYHALNFNYHLRSSLSCHIFSSGLEILTAQNQVKSPLGFWRNRESSSDGRRLKVIESRCHMGRGDGSPSLKLLLENILRLMYPGALGSSISI